MNSIKKPILFSIIFSLIFSMLFSAGGIYFGLHYFSPEKTTNPQPQENKKTLIPSITSTEDDYVTKLVEEKKKAVVSIVISKEVQKFRQSNIFDQFFGQISPFGNISPIPQPEENPETQNTPPAKQKVGGGTGFIISEDGLILTNKHVVEDPNAEYTVVMLDGKEYKAEVKATDPLFDLGIIQITDTKEKFPILSLGDSDNVKVGQTVLAIGNALAEFAGTVTKGIVSGLNRDAYAGDGRGNTEKLSNVFQVDVAINPGNSGGPLINLQGEVIGINTAVANAQNIGFVLPINDVKQGLESFKSEGKIIRPKLGVRYLPINESIQKENNLPYSYGALVIRGTKPTDLSVIPGGPADKAGIEENDIILEIDGVKVDQDNSIVEMIQKHKIGDTVKLKIWHDGKEREVETKLEEIEMKN